MRERAPIEGWSKSSKDEEELPEKMSIGFTAKDVCEGGISFERGDGAGIDWLRAGRIYRRQPKLAKL